ncbi:diacylglycerol kinase [Thermocrispum sp.]|uniref:diacylglycerol kinase n=1 Tax=Thermocrispum sp. TaxID=2060768 RepID=UPI00257A445A|nr:diacylglycerol kinase [Thermocrispum sp.]
MSDVRSVVVLTNPAAGVGQADKSARRAVGRLRERGVDVVDVAGNDPQDARRIAKAVLDQGPDALVVVGGDGMIHLAVQMMAGRDIPLGVIPAGTGNDVAREFGLPRGAPEAAADVVADGHHQPIDLARITRPDGGHTYFATVMACGFDSLVNDRANRMRWPRGRSRYTVAMLAELAALRPLPFRIELADGTTVERELILAAVGNTRSYGGGMRICPGADPADGLLDLTLVEAMPRGQLVRFFPTVFSGKHVEREEVECLRARSIRVTCPGITAYADGDFVAELPVEVDVLPASLKLLRPRPRGR